MPAFELLPLPGKKFAACVGLMGGIALALSGTGEPGHIDITDSGHGVIESLTLGAGDYCNGKAQVQIGDAATFSWKPTLAEVPKFVPGIGGHKVQSAVHATIKQSMEGLFTADLCISTDRPQTVKEDAAGNYTFTLRATRDPKVSDFNLKVYPNDDTQLKYHNDGGNWVKRLDDATFGNLRNNLNTLPFFHFTGNENIYQVLAAVDRKEAFNYLSLKCGPKLIDMATAADLPGGNEEELMIKDMFRFVPKGYKLPDPKKIRWNIINDHTGVPNQFSGLKTTKIPGTDGELQLPNDPTKMDPCTSVVKKIKHVK